MKIFLGGTCNESTWRDDLIPLLEDKGIKYFNPVVPDWTEECYQEELRQRKICDKVLYIITPKMTGVYSIAEVVDDSNKRPEKTVFGVMKKDYTYYDEGVLKYSELKFNKSQMRSLSRVVDMININGAKAKIIEKIEDILELL